MWRVHRLGAVLALVLASREGFAGHPLHGRMATPPPGRPRIFEHSHARAGDPLCVSPHATPTNGPAYVGYYVGGGSACRGYARRPEDGTWGWDYGGLHLPRRIRLSWSHGRREQGGTGAYRTDGTPLHVECMRPGHGHHPGPER